MAGLFWREAGEERQNRATPRKTQTKEKEKNEKKTRIKGKEGGNREVQKKMKVDLLENQGS